MKVIDIKLAARPELIKLLEDILVDAKSGEVTSIAIAMIMSGDDTASAFCVSRAPVSLIGELQILQREITDHSVDLMHKSAGMPYE